MPLLGGLVEPVIVLAVAVMHRRGHELLALGRVDPDVLEALRGSHLIVHAGDIGDPVVLEELTRIAPVKAVRGNNDKGAWARAIPESHLLDLGGMRLYVIHELAGRPALLDNSGTSVHEKVTPDDDTAR